MEQVPMYEKQWREASFDLLWLRCRLVDIYKQDDGMVAEAMVLSTLGLLEGVLRSERMHPDVRQLMELSRPTEGNDR